MAVDTMRTRDELDKLPDDSPRGASTGFRVLGFGHQRMALRLSALLEAACRGTDLEVLFGCFDMVLGFSVVDSDLVVARSVRTARVVGDQSISLVVTLNPSALTGGRQVRQAFAEPRATSGNH